MSDQVAPNGTVFVCGACGETSPTLYGFETPGWDESCMLNATLCKLEGSKWVPVNVKGGVEKWIRNARYGESDDSFTIS